MAKENIKKLLEESQKRLEDDNLTFEKIIKENLRTFKKKTLDKF